MPDLTSEDTLRTVCAALGLDAGAYSTAFETSQYRLAEVHGMSLRAWVFYRLGRYWMPRGPSFWDAVSLAMPAGSDSVDDLRAAYRLVERKGRVGRL
jgi:hypothetical protein